MAGIPKALQQLHCAMSHQCVISSAKVLRGALIVSTQIFTDVCTHQLRSGRVLVVSASATVQGTAMDGAADAPLGPYEQQRADRIARNQKVLGVLACDRALSFLPAVPCSHQRRQC